MTALNGESTLTPCCNVLFLSRSVEKDYTAGSSTRCSVLITPDNDENLLDKPFGSVPASDDGVCVKPDRYVRMRSKKQPGLRPKRKHKSKSKSKMKAISSRLPGNAGEEILQKQAELDQEIEVGETSTNFDQAIELDAEIPFIVLLRGLAQIEMKNFDLAIADFDTTRGRTDCRHWFLADAKRRNFATENAPLNWRLAPVNFRIGMMQLARLCWRLPTQKLVTFKRR